jgi:hypothetical protein
MKKWTLTLLAAAALEAQAGDYTYKYLVLTDAQGNTTSVSTDGLTLRVPDGNLVATNSLGTATFALSQLASMAFSESATSAVTAINALPGNDAPIEAFTTGGVSMGTFGSMSQLRATLSKGVYIVKQNGTTKKITVK